MVGGRASTRGGGRGGLVHKYTEAEKEKFNLKIRYLKDAINHLGLGILHCCTPLVLPAPSPTRSIIGGAGIVLVEG